MKASTILLMRRIYKYKNQLILLLILSLAINLLTHNVQFIRKYFILNSENKEIDYEHNNEDLKLDIQKIHDKDTLIKNIKIPEIKKIEKNNVKYPNLLKCYNNYNDSMLNETDRKNYQNEADKRLYDLKIVRGVIIYFPVAKLDWFEQEFKWLYRSWVEIQKYETKLWRTDLIVFLDYKLYEKQNRKTFHELNCLITNVRKTRNELPMCTILDYVQIKDREIPFLDKKYFQETNSETIYHYLFKEFDIFDDTPENLWKFYGKIKELDNYNYADSILMAFDGYKYFKNNFDFLMRTDMVSSFYLYFNFYFLSIYF